jgi:hypothetical protein
LPLETEARWRLVETAWGIGIAPTLLSVQYDASNNAFFTVDRKLRRVDVTSSRDALNGYQKGKCFYCFRDISIDPRFVDLADVDHFVPHTLLTRDLELRSNLNGVWNLVLACRSCNRGERGKSARLPTVRMLERLHTRNNFLIDSHHPLRETLMSQTGTNEPARRRFLQRMYETAKGILIHPWEPTEELERAF